MTKNANKTPHVISPQKAFIFEHPQKGMAGCHHACWFARRLNLHITSSYRTSSLINDLVLFDITLQHCFPPLKMSVSVLFLSLPLLFALLPLLIRISVKHLQIILNVKFKRTGFYQKFKALSQCSVIGINRFNKQTKKKNPKQNNNNNIKKTSLESGQVHCSLACTTSACFTTGPPGPRRAQTLSLWCSMGLLWARE